MFCQIEQFALTAIRLVFEVKKKKLKKNSGVYTQSWLETNIVARTETLTIQPINTMLQEHRRDEFNLIGC